MSHISSQVRRNRGQTGRWGSTIDGVSHLVSCLLYHNVTADVEGVSQAYLDNFFRHLIGLPYWRGMAILMSC